MCKEHAGALYESVMNASDAVGTSQYREGMTVSAPLIQSLAEGIESAVDLACGGAKSVPAAVGWADATKAVGSGSGQWMPDSAELWLAKRVFERGTRLSDRVGRNEKTRISVRLQRPDPPATSKRKKGSAAKKMAEAAQVQPTTTDGVVGLLESKILKGYVARQVGSAPAPKRLRPAPGLDPDDEDDGRLTLKLEHFAAVKDHEKARWYLRDERLQEVIKQIDSHVRCLSTVLAFRVTSYLLILLDSAGGRQRQRNSFAGALGERSALCRGRR